MGDQTGCVLVTGANGFVGQAVCRALHLKSLPYRAAMRVLPSGYSQHKFALPVGEINGFTDWKAALTGAGTVVHLAARVHVMADGARDSLDEYRQVNVQGTLNLAQQAVVAGVKRFIFISSVKVNGESTSLGHPFKPDDKCEPLDAYAISKLEAENGLRALAKKSGIEVVVVRPPLVYGPGVRANFSSMVDWVKRGIPLPLGAVTQNRRSLVALDNLVDLILVCILHPNAANQTFLVSDGEDVSTTQLLRHVGLGLGRPARLMRIPPRFLELAAAAMGRRSVAQRLLGSLQVDISKTTELLGWQPPIGLSEGLRRAVKS